MSMLKPTWWRVFRVPEEDATKFEESLKEMAGVMTRECTVKQTSIDVGGSERERFVGHTQIQESPRGWESFESLVPWEYRPTERAFVLAATSPPGIGHGAIFHPKKAIAPLYGKTTLNEILPHAQDIRAFVSGLVLSHSDVLVLSGTGDVVPLPEEEGDVDADDWSSPFERATLRVSNSAPTVRYSATNEFEFPGGFPEVRERILRAFETEVLPDAKPKV